ncbi:unnamed protein product [Camellia sinensis]
MGMEAVIALWNPPYRILRLIFRQANTTARAFIGPRQPLALSQHCLRVVGLYHGLFQAQHLRPYNISSFTRQRSQGGGGGDSVVVRLSSIVAIVTATATSDGAGFDSNAGVGNEHDGRDEDKEADSNGNAVAEANPGGGLRWVCCGHETEIESLEIWV